MVNDKVSIIDAKGEITAFAEGVLMQAYTQGRHRTIRECQAGRGVAKSECLMPYPHTPRKIRSRFCRDKHILLAILVGAFSKVHPDRAA
jgi:hypothetical protein